MGMPPPAVPAVPKYVRTEFMLPLSAVFKRPAEDQTSEMLASAIYGEKLAQFSEDVLRRAAHRIIETREDPWFPPLAVCLKACRRVIEDDERAKNEAEQSAWQHRLRLEYKAQDVCAPVEERIKAFCQRWPTEEEREARLTWLEYRSLLLHLRPQLTQLTQEQPT